MELSDISSAFNLFEHGIRFLDEGHWESDYELSLNLYDAVAEAACFMNNQSAVVNYTEQIVAHAKCPDDRLNGELAF